MLQVSLHNLGPYYVEMKHWIPAQKKQVLEKFHWKRVLSVQDCDFNKGIFTLVKHCHEIWLFPAAFWVKMWDFTLGKQRQSLSIRDSLSLTKPTSYPTILKYSEWSHILNFGSCKWTEQSAWWIYLHKSKVNTLDLEKIHLNKNCVYLWSAFSHREIHLDCKKKKIVLPFIA